MLNIKLRFKALGVIVEYHSQSIKSHPFSFPGRNFGMVCIILIVDSLQTLVALNRIDEYISMGGQERRKFFHPVHALRYSSNSTLW